MTEQATTDTTSTRGPVQPPKPDVSALGSTRAARRAAKLAAAAQQGGASSASTPVNSGDADSDTTVTDHKVAAQQAVTPSPTAERPDVEQTPSSEAVEQATVSPKPATAPVQEPADTAAVVDQDTRTKEPATEQGAEQHERPLEYSTSARAAVTKTASTATAEDTSVTGEQAPAAGGSANSGLDEEGKPAAELRIDGQEPDDGAPDSLVITDPAGAAGAGDVKAPAAEDSSTTDADEQIKPVTELDDEVDDEDLDDEQFTGSKLTQQSWVPDDVADKFQRMQATGHGRTAEVIVLTAVRNCAERLPELIKAARGPVHEDGLFAGLPILDRKPGRQKKAKPNSSRVQYQVSPVYAPDLKRLAKTHKLKLSVLIRLALGDYFGIPVRLGRTKR